MNLKNQTKKIVMSLLMLIFIISLVACGAKHEAVKSDKDPKKIVLDKNYTEDIKKEKGASDGLVYVQGGVVTATIAVKSNVDDTAAKELGQKYEKELKKAYKDDKVNVQVVKDGKNIATIGETKSVETSPIVSAVYTTTFFGKFVKVVLNPGEGVKVTGVKINETALVKETGYAILGDAITIADPKAIVGSTLVVTTDKDYIITVK